jgi:hypothetical protein
LRGPSFLCAAAAALLCAGGAGCAAGRVRELRVGGLARYATTTTTTTIAVEATPGLVGDEAGQPLATGVGAGARRALEAAGIPTEGNGDATRFTLRLRLLAVDAPAAAAAPDPTGRALSAARSLFGLAGVTGGSAGRLELEGHLLAPDARDVGYVHWESEGAPDALAPEGGEASAQALARLVADRRHEWADRRAADERLLLTPTPMTLGAGEVVASDDELLLARLGVGVSRRVQLDLWAGGFPIPGAGAIGGAAHGAFAVGAAGVIVLGFFDLGLKVHVVDEGPYLPGVAIAYDLLDVFGLGAGGVGAVAIGDGAGGGAFAVVAGANAQFNLFTLVAGKHFGPVQVTAGSYLLDNHHYLPQSAAFQAGCGAAATDGSSGTAGAIPCGSGSARLASLPLQVQPFAGGELVLGPHSSLMMDTLLQRRIEDSIVTTGARWLLGWSRPRGPLALDRIRLRIDLGALWFYERAQGGASPHGARVLPIPWLGVGLYFL